MTRRHHVSDGTEKSVESNPFLAMDFHNVAYHDGFFKKRNRPLKWKKKFYEFYAAPITKFYCHSLGYAAFLLFYTYSCLVQKSPEPSGYEWYVFACIVNFFLEKIRQIIVAEPINILKKFQVFITDTKWNLGDSIAILTYLPSFFVRLQDPSTLPTVHVIHSTLITYWYVRSLKFIGANKYFGPFVMMIGKMIEHMIYFVVLLLVVLMAFGVCRQAILFPNEPPDWQLIRHIFYQPYFMLYGEVFAGDISPDCDPDCFEYGKCANALDGSLMVPCHPGRWVTPIVMTVYLLVANLLLLNLLIATFNTIYNSVNAVAQQFWHFQRFTVVIEYEEKPTLPAPFTFISHIHRSFRKIYRVCKGRFQRYQNGLKVILNKHDMERLYDFEEECAEGLMEQRDTETAKTVTERVRNLIDTVEEVKSKIEDLERYESSVQETTNNTEYRLRHIEELSQQTADQIAVIHRFMATQGSQEQSVISEEESQEHADEQIADQEEPEEEEEQDPQTEEDKVRFQDDVISPAAPKASGSSVSDVRPIDNAKSKRIRQFSGSSNAAIRKRRATESSCATSDDHYFSSTGNRRDKLSFRLRRRRRQMSTCTDQGLDDEGTAAAARAAYKRSQSELPSYRDEARSPEDSFSSDASSNTRQQRLKFSSRRKVQTRACRDYTSITDDLEQMIVVTSSRCQSESKSPKHELPAIKIEAEALHDAEETDYNLMETLIERRLRRDSHNLQASLEELVTKSIKDETSSPSTDSEDNSSSGSSTQSSDQPDRFKATSSKFVAKKSKAKRRRAKIGINKRRESRVSLASLEMVVPEPSNVPPKISITAVDSREAEIVICTSSTKALSKLQPKSSNC